MVVRHDSYCLLLFKCPLPVFFFCHLSHLLRMWDWKLLWWLSANAAVCPVQHRAVPGDGADARGAPPPWRPAATGTTGLWTRVIHQVLLVLRGSWFASSQKRMFAYVLGHSVCVIGNWCDWRNWTGRLNVFLTVGSIWRRLLSGGGSRLLSMSFYWNGTFWMFQVFHSAGNVVRWRLGCRCIFFELIFLQRMGHPITNFLIYDLGMPVY